MAPSEIEHLFSAHKPDWFAAKYIMQTEIDATSLIKQIWIKANDEWIQMNCDFPDNASEVMSSSKIKYFIKNDCVHIFANDPALKYNAHVVI